MVAGGDERDHRRSLVCCSFSWIKAWARKATDTVVSVSLSGPKTGGVGGTITETGGGGLGPGIWAVAVVVLLGPSCRGRGGGGRSRWEGHRIRVGQLTRSLVSGRFPLVWRASPAPWRAARRPAGQEEALHLTPGGPDRSFPQVRRTGPERPCGPEDRTGPERPGGPEDGQAHPSWLLGHFPKPIGHVSEEHHSFTSSPL